MKVTRRERGGGWREKGEERKMGVREKGGGGDETGEIRSYFITQG